MPLMRRLLPLLLLLVLAAPAAATPVTQKKAIWGPVTRDGKSQFPIYKDLGVGIFQDKISWASTATTRPAHPTDPADPAYQWPSELDTAVTEGRKYGIRVSLMVLGAPRWANGGKPANYAPTNPQDYADFITAAAKRYPGIRLWMVWGEPTRGANWQPTTYESKSHLGEPLNAKQKTSPHAYARLLDRAYGALKGVRRSNVVIGGNSFTTGDITTLNWIKNLRLPNGKAPRMDLWGHNPISGRRPGLDRPPLGRGYADMSDVDQVAGWLDRYIKIPGRHAPLRLFLSEWVLQTDEPGYEVSLYVTRNTAALWTRDALRIARAYKRIYTFGWFQLYDDAPRADNRQTRYGLLDAQGGHKPAYAAFRKG